MDGGGGGHCTLVLCSPTDTLADELEPLCRNTSEQVQSGILPTCIAMVSQSPCKTS